MLMAAEADDIRMVFSLRTPIRGSLPSSVWYLRLPMLKWFAFYSSCSWKGFSFVASLPMSSTTSLSCGASSLSGSFVHAIKFR